MNTLTTPDSPISPRSEAAVPDPFASRYGRSLPSPLRAEAAGMTWTAFADTYAPTTGPISALTDMLYRLGAGVEIVSLHRYEFTGGVATFPLCERDDRRTWSMGNGRTGQESALTALIAGANRLD